MEMTKELFKKEIEEIGASGKVFIVESEDSGSVYFSMYQSHVYVDTEDGINGEITIFRPYTSMEARLDFDIIDTITKEDDGAYTVEFNNGMADLTIRPTDAEKEPVVDNDELCSFISKGLTGSSFTPEAISKILDLEMEFLKSKGLAE